MTGCFAPGCNHRHGDQLRCKLYRFPTNTQARTLWERATRRQDQKVKDSSRLCSCHFYNGDRREVPSLFKYNGYQDQRLRALVATAATPRAPPSGGLEAGPSASVLGVQHTEDPSGGLEAGPSASVLGVQHTEAPSGGLEAGPSASVLGVQHTEDPSGGLEAGPSASVLGVQHTEAPSGGLEAGPSASVLGVQHTEAPSGGLEAGPSASVLGVQHTEDPSGGLEAGPSASVLGVQHTEDPSGGQEAGPNASVLGVQHTEAPRCGCQAAPSSSATASSQDPYVCACCNEVAVLKRHIQELEKNAEREEQHMLKIVTKTQLQAMRSGRRPRKWDDETLTKALSLRASMSQKLFDYLRVQQKWPLPSARTLRRWVCTFQITPGSFSSLLAFLEAAAVSMRPLEKNCAILCDELSIDSRIVYDRTHDIVRGPHKQAQVIMVRSICGGWKQPVMFAFDTAVTQPLLLVLIHALENRGFPVRALVSDMGSTNRGLWRQLDITHDGHTGIVNPSAPDRHVWFFADVPHCLKNVRNHILDDGLHLHQRQSADTRPAIDKALLQALLEITSVPQYKMCFKLTDKHINAEHADRQRVYLAAQLLSATTSTAISEVFEGEEEAATTIKIIDDGFDTLNSRRLYTDKPLRCALGVPEHWEQQKLALERLRHLLETARFGEKTMLPCQKGWIVSIRSTLSLFEEMRRVAGFSYLLTARLNQDALESYFSIIRARFGSNVNPSPVELLQRARLLLIGAAPAAAHSTVVQEESAAPSAFLLAARPQDADEPDSVSVAVVVRVCEGAEVQQEIREAETEAEEAQIPAVLLEEAHLNPDGEPTEEEQAEDTSDPAQRYAMAYVAGYVAAKCARVEPSLGIRSPDAGEDVPDDARWVQLMSRGGLTVPTKQWLGTFHKMEAIFCCLHRDKGALRRNMEPDQLSREPGVVGGLTTILQERWPLLDSRVVCTYARLRTMMRMRHVAQVRRRDHGEALREAAARRRAAKPAVPRPLPSDRALRKRRQFARGAAQL